MTTLPVSVSLLNREIPVEEIDPAEVEFQEHQMAIDYGDIAVEKDATNIEAGILRRIPGAWVAIERVQRRHTYKGEGTFRIYWSVTIIRPDNVSGTATEYDLGAAVNGALRKIVTA